MVREICQIVTILLTHLSCPLLAQAPPNDNRSSATALRIAETISGTLQNATIEEDEPRSGSPTRTVWYRWQATEGTSELRLSSQQARVIAIAYLEDESGPLVEIGRTAFRQNEPSDDTSSNRPFGSYGIRLQTQADETIFFQIYNLSATLGDFSLELSPFEIETEGDSFRDATELPAKVDQHFLDLGATTRERFEPPTGFQSLWLARIHPNLWRNLRRITLDSCHHEPNYRRQPHHHAPFFG